MADQLPSFELEEKYKKYGLVAGVDEVGRGSLVGPVLAAAVIFKKKINKEKIKDS